MAKIAFIVPYRFNPPMNGGHKAAYGLADFLSRSGLSVCISTTNNEISTTFRLVPLFKDTPSKYFNPGVGWRIASFLQKEAVSYCILQQPFQALLLWPFLKWQGIQLGIYVQNIEFQRFRSLGKWWWPFLYVFEWCTFRLANHLFFIAPTDVTIAQNLLHVAKNKCIPLNYGTYLTETPKDRASAKRQVVQNHQFEPNTKLLLFFGPQSYLPNFEAVQLITNELYPLLMEKLDADWEILICGGGLPEQDQQSIRKMARLHYLGFVEDIETYVKSADVMLNPIVTGGGVKTKIIESIALGTPVISFASGAEGVNRQVTEGMLAIVGDGDAGAFVSGIVHLLNESKECGTSSEFYDHYAWQKSIHKIIKALEKE